MGGQKGICFGISSARLHRTNEGAGGDDLDLFAVHRAGSWAQSWGSGGFQVSDRIRWAGNGLPEPLWWQRYGRDTLRAKAGAIFNLLPPSATSLRRLITRVVELAPGAMFSGWRGAGNIVCLLDLEVKDWSVGAKLEIKRRLAKADAKHKPTELESFT